MRKLANFSAQFHGIMQTSVNFAFSFVKRVGPTPSLFSRQTAFGLSNMFESKGRRSASVELSNI